MNSTLKSLFPHLVAIAAFILLSSIYFSPLFDGYSLKQSDIRQFQGMSKEIVDYEFVHGEKPLWTNAMFGGMPTYQISVDHNANWLTYVDQAIKFGLPRPVGILFVSMLGFYILALCLRVNPWLGIIGAIAFGFSTINVLYIGAGHMSKVNAIAYMAPALGGLILAFRGKWLLGAAVFGLFFGLNLTANHLQMTYYLSFLLGAVALSEVIRLALQKEWVYLGKTVGALMVVSTLTLMASASNLMTTFEYSKYTTRGTSDLTLKPKGQAAKMTAKEGLNKNYILEYNFGGGEWLSIVAPNAKGGKTDLLGNNEKAAEIINANPDYYQYSDVLLNTDPSKPAFPSYWGGQSFSGGAFYFGVVMLFFFLMGLIFLKDSLKWPFLVIGILAILLSSNDPGGINDFFINKFPLYNKFRDSKMIMTLLQIMIPALGVLFLDKLLRKEGLLGDKKAWLIGSASIVFLAVILYASPSLSGEFMTKNELKMFADQAKSVKDPSQISYLSGMKNAVEDVRIELFKSDLGRSIFFLFLGAGIVLLLSRTSLPKGLIVGGLALLVLSDNISVNKRYLNNETPGDQYSSYVIASDATIPYAPNPSDMSILSREKVPSQQEQLIFAKMGDNVYFKDALDQEMNAVYAKFGALNLNSNYRVLNFSNPFAETATSFFHKSLGGYHGAKLKRYQELIDFAINDEMQQLNKEISDLKNTKLREYGAKMQLTQELAQQIFDTITVDELAVSDKNPAINMLNTKYIVVNPNQKAIKNTNANGPVWFVNQVNWAANANEELLSLRKIDTKKQAVIHTEFKSLASGTSVDTNASILLTKYETTLLKYVSESKSDQIAVFSEIYYPEGWNCYVDGKQIETFRANYVLRAAKIEKGKHQIEWKFEPKAFQKGSNVSFAGSSLLILACIGVFWMNRKVEIKEEA
ncbi:MAG: YfhO family protein [Crocinitomicaceae bacterium]|nr:YfhO family protein [Crocinitomicaceae bacterium]